MARRAFEVLGVSEAVQKIDGVANRARDPLPHQVSNAIVKEMKSDERKRFHTGRGWRRLTPRWLAYKRTHGYDVRKLVQTGGLERTLTEGGPDLLVTVSKYQLVFGLKRDARYIATAKIRKPVMASREARKAISMTVQMYVAHTRR